MNERITEGFVRDHLKADPLFSQAIVEEQKSKNPRIEKLLQLASKSGVGRGRPEFILTFPSVLDFLIVIECKADTRACFGWIESGDSLGCLDERI